MNWFVVHTKPRFEKKVEERLLSLGIEAYCPVRKEIRLWSDRKKKVDVPVLPSMVLVKLEEKKVNDVFNVNGVVRYMFWLGKRAIVREKEIDILKTYYLKLNLEILLIFLDLTMNLDLLIEFQKIMHGFS